MKNVLIGCVAVAIGLSIPTVASAHTGSVKCDATGVVFTYDDNFQHDTWVAENVGGALRVIKVPAHTVTSDTWKDVTGKIVVSATWHDGDVKGGIPEQTLTCPEESPSPPKPTTTPPTTTPPAPPVCPPGTNSAGMSNGVLVCVTPAPPPQTLTVTNTVTNLPVVSKTPKCPKGTKLYRKFGTSVICMKRKVIVKHKVKLVPYTPVKEKKTIRGAGGVTG